METIAEQAETDLSCGAMTLLPVCNRNYDEIDDCLYSSLIIRPIYGQKFKLHVFANSLLLLFWH